MKYNRKNVKKTIEKVILFYIKTQNKTLLQKGYKNITKI